MSTDRQTSVSKDFNHFHCYIKNCKSEKRTELRGQPHIRSVSPSPKESSLQN